MRAFLRLCFVAALLPAGGATADATGTIGVVIMHGKPGTPGQLAKLAAALTTAGYPVETPEMCWSKKRIGDENFTDCLADVDAAIVKLKTNGATKIVVAGTSQGAVAALAYGATHPGIAGVVAMAPAGDPPNLSQAPALAASIESATALTKAGKGDAVTVFNDVITGAQPVTVKATPNAFLSFHGPDSPIATMKRLIAKVLPQLKVPVLWVSGSRDPSQVIAPQAFATVPKHTLSRAVTIDADHAGTPDVAGDAVTAWLASLN